MFGHQDDQQDHHDQQPTENLIPAPTIDGMLSADSPTTSPLTNDSPAPVAPGSDFNPALPPSDFSPAISPAIVSSDEPVTTAPIVSDEVAAVVPANPTPMEEHPSVAPTGDTNDLLDIKQHALTELTPLVGHLEQSPEEKFRTTMMMIQASDNQDLIKVAYEAAQAMTDDKIKAQALLDIVNEINYFTQAAAGTPAAA